MQEIKLRGRNKDQFELSKCFLDKKKIQKSCRSFDEKGRITRETSEPISEKVRNKKSEKRIAPEPINLGFTEVALCTKYWRPERDFRS